MILTLENENGPTLLLGTKSTGSSKLYNLLLRAFQRSVGHDNCYIKITEGEVRLN